MYLATSGGGLLPVGEARLAKLAPVLDVDVCPFLGFGDPRGGTGGGTFDFVIFVFCLRGGTFDDGAVVVIGCLFVFVRTADDCAIAGVGPFQ